MHVVYALPKKHLTLLMVTDKFPWSSRPFINNQIEGLTKKGHTVHVLATTSIKNDFMPTCLSKYDLSKRIHYEKLPSNAPQFDAILIQFPQSEGAQKICALHKKGELKGKLILFFRGEDLSAMIKKNAHRYDALFKQADLCLPVCDYFKQRLISLGCPSRKIQVVHSAIHCEAFTFKERFINPHQKISLISTSRLVAKKGIKFALLAAIRLHKQYPTLEYTIIGDGPERPMLAQIIELCQAQEYVHLEGQLPHEQVAKQLDKADIYILPSVTSLYGDQEGIPNALMEAMASGLPVVSSYHAGIPELITHDVTGHLTVERDVNALVEALKVIIEQDSKVRTMARAARAHVECAHNTFIENDKLEKLLLDLF